MPLTELFDQVLAGRHLLEHPFYRRWESGDLAPGELAAYAGQYRHFEAALPGLLERLAAGTADPQARAAIEANLADELGEPAPHLELFDQFLAAVGGSADDPASPRTAALLGWYEAMAATSAAAALAALAAYEVQASAIAASKADGLRARYGVDARGTAFWDVHGAMETEHAGWTLEALEALGAGDAVVRKGAEGAARAWWAFLDEREAAREALVAG